MAERLAEPGSWPRIGHTMATTGDVSGMRNDNFEKVMRGFKH